MMRDHCYKIEGNEIISLGNRSQFSQILETLTANDWVLAIVIYKKAMHSYFDALFQILLIEKEEKDIRSFLKRYLESKYFYVIHRK